MRSSVTAQGLETSSAPTRRLSVPAPAAAPRTTPFASYRLDKQLALSLACGACTAVAFAAQRFLGWPAWGWVTLYLAAYAFGSFELLRKMVAVLRERRFPFDIDLLMILAAVGAACLGQWAEGALLLFMFSLANALETYAMGRARRAIHALAELTPAVARVVRDGREAEVPVEQVPVGEVVLVRPAERVPVDGTVRSGRSAVDQAPITGESIPLDKSPGDEVFAGTINGQGALEVVTTRAAGDRTLDRVIQLVEEAQAQKSPTQHFTERFETFFVPAVLIVDLLVIVLPPLIGLPGWTWSVSFYRGMALLTGASPCALALGTPAAVLAGVAQAARNGVLVKGGMHLENLGIVRALALDKTGTLTTGRPEVTDVVPARAVSADELLRIAAAVERKSQHPLARAIVRRAEASGIELPASGDLHSVTARGVRSSVGGVPVEIGSLLMWNTWNAPTAPIDSAANGDGNGDVARMNVPVEVVESVDRLRAAGRSVVIVRHGERFLGVLGLADPPRPKVRPVIDRLRALGIRPIVILTGDHAGVADAVARQVGVDEARAGLLAEDKVNIVRDLEHAHGHVAMVGDGVNDAPALAAATVGVAMGGAGTAAALETADVALMGDDLGKLLFAVELSRKANAIIRQNVTIALSVIVLLIVSTTTGLLGIGWAVLFHEGSTLVVIANALRLLGFRGSDKAKEPGSHRDTEAQRRASTLAHQCD
jgi:Cd2+/Zn2+-exporting ATPase